MRLIILKEKLMKRKFFLYFVKEEVEHKMLEDKILSEDMQIRIKPLKEKLEKEICTQLPNSFWQRMRHGELTYD